MEKESIENFILSEIGTVDTGRLHGGGTHIDPPGGLGQVSVVSQGREGRGALDTSTHTGEET